jgi:PAS domain S-box-containing protein
VKPLLPPDVAGTLTIRDGIVVYASEGVAALAGLTPERMVGRPFLDFVAPEERALIADRYARRRRGEPVPQRYEGTMTLPGGGHRRVEIHVDVDGEVAIVHVRDVAERAARRLRLEAVATLGAALQRELSEAGIFSRLRDGLGALGLSCALLRAEPDGVRVVWASFPEMLGRTFRERAGLAIDGFLGRWTDFSRHVYAEGSAFTEDWGFALSHFTSRPAGDEVSKLVAAAGLTRAVGVRVGEKEDAGQHLLVVGDWLGGEDVPALRLLAAQLAAALAAARRVSELTLLNDLALAAAQSDPDSLLESAVRRVCETLATDLGAAYVRDGERLTLINQVGLDEECERRVAVLSVGEGAPGLAVSSGTPVQTGAADGYAGKCGHVAAGAEVQALVAVPLLAKNQAVGALVFGRRERRGFTPGEVSLLSAIGVQIGLAVDAARLLSDVKRRAADLEAVNALALLTFEAAPGDLRALLEAGCKEIARALSCRAATVFLSEGPGRLRGTASWGAPLDVTELVIDLDRDRLAREAMRRRVPGWAEDVTSDPESAFHGHPGMPPLAMLAVPLGSRAETPGVLFLADPAGRAFSDAEVALATALAGVLGMGLENARLYSDARRRVDELSLLNREITTGIEVARVVSSSLDLEEVLGAGADHLMRILGAPACTILLLGRGDELRRAAARGEPIGPERAPRDAPSLPREALEARAPLAGRPGTPDAGVLAVPLHVRELPVGVALVAAATAGRSFGPGELARATAIASQLAVAVDNARLYSEARRRAEELGLLHEVGRSLVETLDIQRVLDRGVQNLARIVDAPEASLLLVTPDGRALEVRAVAGSHGVAIGLRLPLDPETSLAALVAHCREPVVIEDGQVDPRVNPTLNAQTKARGYLGLPLLVRERTIGAVLIMETRAPRRFTPAEVERAAAIANQLAVAVENARLYEDLRHSYAELERAQHRLVQRERLAALGELSAIVAHEVRNPLGVIFNSLGSLRRLVRPTGDAKLLLDIVGEEADRLNRIVGDLLDFARPSTPLLRPGRLGDVAEEAIGVALAQKSAEVEIVRELDPGVPPVPMDARLVRQAVLNVIVNAIQAIPHGGRVTVRTRRVGDAVVLEVEDTGTGIPEEVGARIFEPFFTTKASGTGLGLAVVRRIVEGHGGTATVRNQLGTGALFALTFPLAAGTVEKDRVLG